MINPCSRIFSIALDSQAPHQDLPAAGAIEEHEFSDTSSGQEDIDPPSGSGTSESSLEPELEHLVEAGSALIDEDSDADLEPGDAGRESPILSHSPIRLP